MTQLITDARFGAWKALPSPASLQRALRLMAVTASGVLACGLWMGASQLRRNHQRIEALSGAMPVATAAPVRAAGHASGSTGRPVATEPGAEPASIDLGPLIGETVVEPLLSGGEVRFGELLDRAARTLADPQPQAPAFPQDRLPSLPTVHAPPRAVPQQQVRGDFITHGADAA